VIRRLVRPSPLLQRLFSFIGHAQFFFGDGYSVRRSSINSCTCSQLSKPPLLTFFPSCSAGCFFAKHAQSISPPPSRCCCPFAPVGNSTVVPPPSDQRRVAYSSPSFSHRFFSTISDSRHHWCVVRVPVLMFFRRGGELGDPPWDWGRAWGGVRTLTLPAEVRCLR